MGKYYDTLVCIEDMLNNPTAEEVASNADEPDDISFALYEDLRRHLNSLLLLADMTGCPLNDETLSAFQACVAQPPGQILSEWVGNELYHDEKYRMNGESNE